MNKSLLAASILSADFSRLGEEVNQVINAGVDMIHFDVMDNHYVPNLTIGPMVLKSLVNYGIQVPFDVHLMVKPVDILIPMFAQAGANYITFHPEASNHIDRTLQLIRNYGCKAGLALNPATSLSYIEYVMDKLDLVLLMSVNPGFSGQTFISATLNKLKQLRYLVNKNKYNILIEIDGGVKPSNIKQIAKLGADVFVIGSAIFNFSNYKIIIDSLRKALTE